MSSITERRSLRSLGCFILSALFLSLFLISPTYAQVDYYWVGGSGSWSDPLKWSPNGQPQGGDTAYLTQGGGTNISVGYNSTFGNSDYLNQLYVDATGTGGMTLNVNGGLLQSNTINVGYAGQGTMVQSDGSVFLFPVSIIVPPGTGLRIGTAPGSSGTYILNGGTLTSDIYVPQVIGSSTGTGLFLQTGGTNTVINNAITIGEHGTYTQTGGTLALRAEGTLIVYGTYNLSGGGIADLKDDVLLAKGGVINQSGGAVINAGMIWGAEIEGTYNLSGGTLQAYVQNRMSGVFNQTGGTADLQPFGGTFTNSGVLSLGGGSLTITSTRNGPQMINNGTMNYTGGALHLNLADYQGVPGALTNNGTVNLSGSGTRTVDANVINNGTFKTTHTTAVYTGTFTNNGAYFSDPATQYFNNLTVGQNGYLVGQNLDKFFISGDFINQSTMNTAWNTSHAYLGFTTGDDALHDLYLTGADYGPTMSAYADNFAWGTLDLTGEDLYL